MILPVAGKFHVLNADNCGNQLLLLMKTRVFPSSRPAPTVRDRHPSDCKPLKAWTQTVQALLPRDLCHSLGVVLTSLNQEMAARLPIISTGLQDAARDESRVVLKSKTSWISGPSPNITERNSCFYFNAWARFMPPSAVPTTGTQSLFQTATCLPKTSVLLL